MRKKKEGFRLELPNFHQGKGIVLNNLNSALTGENFGFCKPINRRTLFKFEALPMKDSTKLIRSGDYNKEFAGKPVRTVNPPVYSGSTVLFADYDDLLLANAGKYDGITYGTDRLPTQRDFEEALRNLEGGSLTRAFQSGISAINNTLLAFTASGDHILVCLFAFTFKEDYAKEKIAAFIDSLDLFGIGYSWGGFKSLITAGKYSRPADSIYYGKTVVRLNIGLEDAEDLMQDLEKGFDMLNVTNAA